MCGIAGIVGPGRGATSERLRDMAAALAHRGPNGEGYLLGDLDEPPMVRYGPLESEDQGRARTVGLAHRRLSVIDLESGQQPLSNEDGTVWVVYNGELYNYRELRRRLERAGHRFRTQSDTEVIVHQYEEDGDACVRAFSGIFAFALWDARRRRILLARDRLGVKPLYYALRGNQLLFASEIKALLVTGLVPRVVNCETLAQYFTFQNTFGDRTFLETVRLLPPATTLTYDLSTGDASQHRWWNWSYRPDASISIEEWARRLRETFTGVIKRQLMADVPIGSFLSGGMDTGAIATIARTVVHPLPTFTCGFEMHGVDGDEQMFDERAAAAALASRLGTEHHEMVLTAADMWQLLPSVVWHLDEPRVGMSYQNFALAKFARRRVTVALSGVGGDELFGGYPWRYQQVLGMDTTANFAERYAGLWARVVSPEQLPDLFSHEAWQRMRSFHPVEAVREVLADCPATDALHRALYFDAKTFLHGLLIMEDKLSMAHGLEVRAPFTDEALLDLVEQMPAPTKVTGSEAKVVLKMAMKDVLPPEVLQRRKVGFTPPERSWQRGAAEGVRQFLLSPRSLERGYFQPAYLQRMLEAHQSGQADHRRLVWSLMCFEWWSRFVLDGEAAPNVAALHQPAEAMWS